MTERPASIHPGPRARRKHGLRTRHHRHHRAHHLGGDRVLARVAGRKGHSFLGFFIFSLFFFPAAIIVPYLVDDRSGLATAVT